MPRARIFARRPQRKSVPVTVTPPLSRAQQAAAQRLEAQRRAERAEARAAASERYNRRRAAKRQLEAGTVAHEIHLAHRRRVYTESRAADSVNEAAESANQETQDGEDADLPELAADVDDDVTMTEADHPSGIHAAALTTHCIHVVTN